MNKRILQFIDYLGISVSEFERTCNLSNGAVSKMGDNTRRSTIDKISNVYPELNTDWLLTNKGNMLKSEQSSLLLTTNKSMGNSENQNSLHVIKYYPNVNGSMGGVEFLDDPNEAVCCISIPGYSEYKFAINAYGDSMYPLIKSGQIVLMSEWLERFIDWGRIYLIVTKSGYRAIKRLYPGSSNTTVTCKSENSETNPPFEIEKDDIHKVYLVKGWICRDAI